MRFGGLIAILGFISIWVNGWIAGWFIVHDLWLDLVLAAIIAVWYFRLHRPRMRRNAEIIRRNKRLHDEMYTQWAHEDAVREQATTAWRARHAECQADRRRTSPQVRPQAIDDDGWW